MIFETFLTSVLPVGALFFLGLWMGRRHVFQLQDATLFFKFVGQIAVPAIIISILISTDFTNSDITLIWLYLLVEFLIYGLGFMVAFFLFRLPVIYAVLIGMACSFSNHVLFVLPISDFIFDVSATLPLRGAIAIDTLSLTFSAILLDVIRAKQKGQSAQLITHLKHPLLLCLIIGAPFVIGVLRAPVPMIRMADFIAATAAPLALFASGILLSQKVSAQGVKIAAMITIIKMAIFPALAVVIILQISGYSLDEARTILMVAAAPVGLMPMTFASRYQVETASIALSMLLSFILSLIALPIIASI
ncbi:MAG: AEC family transporter [Candidatus Puniceispirillaceae bacterium]